jgi:diguanylate cyclase (GGDEF)-like protein
LWKSNRELAAAYKEEGRATALAIGSSFASDFHVTNLDRPAALRERLDEMKALNPSIRTITIYRRGDGFGVRVASTARGALGPVDAHDTQPIATGRSEYVEEREGGEHVGELNFPLEDRSTGARVAAIGLYLDLAPLDAALTTRTQRLTVAAGLAAALLASVMLLVLGRTVLRPLDRLRLATRHIKSGQLDARLGWKRSDTIGELARDFDEMAHEIQVSHDRLRDLALHDPLTGLLNHRAAQERLEAELARAHRDGRSVVVVVLDIDYFKSINDRHGHAAGDEALRLVAQAIVSTLRPADFCGRVGGDEFIVGLYGVDARQAADVVARIRGTVGAVEVSAGGYHLTISAGIAEFPLHATNSVELTRLADAAMYWSKRTGRDRQSLHSPSVGPPQGDPTPSWDGL